MNMDQFIDRVLTAAKAAEIDTAEVYYEQQSEFSANAMDGEIDRYEVSDRMGLSLRGTYQGKMGSSYTQAFDEAAIAQLVEGVKGSAQLVENEDQDEIYAGDESYPTLPEVETDLAQVSAEDKLAFCVKMEETARNADPRVYKVDNAMLATATSLRRIKNTLGMDLSETSNECVAVTYLVARDGEHTATGGKERWVQRFADLDAEQIAAKGVQDAVSHLGGEPVPGGEYRVVMDPNAMKSMLRTFSGIFSAENAQQNMSLLKGKEGEVIASPIVCLMDEPLRPGCPATRWFDDEGVACQNKAVIEHGVLKTLLHSRKTAKKQNVRSTGNASRGAAVIHVAPTNFFFQPGEKSQDELLADMGNGLLITDLSGLHSGANATSGDFSLLSNGFLVENGRKVRPVERITIAGNFYELLKNIRAIGNDLTFEGSPIGSPSVDVGTLKVSG